MPRINLFVCVQFLETHMPLFLFLFLLDFVTFGAFFVGAVSIIGLPPFAGSWSKWLLVLGSIEADQIFIVAAFMISSLLNVAYLLPIISRGFFASTSNTSSENLQGIKEAPALCWIPTVITAAGCFILFLSISFTLQIFAKTETTNLSISVVVGLLKFSVSDKIADINIPAIGTGICCLLRINVCANIVLILPHGRISKYIGELLLGRTDLIDEV